VPAASSSCIGGASRESGVSPAAVCWTCDANLEVGRWLTAQPYLPRSKQIDHPRCTFIGTWNGRPVFLCQACFETLRLEPFFAGPFDKASKARILGILVRHQQEYAQVAAHGRDQKRFPQPDPRRQRRL
jgi:hypothetical protein